MPPDSCLLISDFNLNTFAGYLANDVTDPMVRVTRTGFGQVFQTLMDSSHSCWTERPDVAVVWTQPDAVIPSFSTVLSYVRPPLSRILEDVDRFADILVAAIPRVRCLILPSWTKPAYDRGLGMLDYREGGLSYVLAQMNIRLADRLSQVGNAYVLDAGRWVHHGGLSAHDPKFWYMAKVPFSPIVFKQAVIDVKAVIRAINGSAKKLLILDLDNTLWGGTVGDLGWENVRLGGHDPVGEAFVDFQMALKGLKSRGIILAVVSKNDEAIAMETIDRNPEMVLRRGDLAGWRINWNDKAQNILELVQELNLGLEAAVFVDDNPAERGRIAETLPEVYVPDWPNDKMLYRQALLSLSCFDLPAIGAEDVQRTDSYVAERGRRDLLKAVSPEEWLKTLNLQVRIKDLNLGTLQRAAQLLNKTNQMNLATRRMTETEFLDWASQPLHCVRTFRVSDRFGNYGLVGIVGLDYSGTQVQLVDFVLSCRVFGRHIENVMLYAAIQDARSQGKDTVQAEYVATDRNKPALDFFVNRSRYTDAGESKVFLWDTAEMYRCPEFIDITFPEPEIAS